MKVPFLDKFDGHKLAFIDCQYPLFVLGGHIVDKSYAEGSMTDVVRDFKQRLLKCDNVILCTADIAYSHNDKSHRRSAVGQHT